MRRNLFTVPALVGFSLASLATGIVLLQLLHREVSSVEANVVRLSDSEFVTRIPFSRETCIAIDIGVGMQRERLEVDGTIVESDDLESFLEAKINENQKAVKAIVFCVGVSANSSVAAEATVRQVAMRRSLEFFRFIENSKKSLAYGE